MGKKGGRGGFFLHGSRGWDYDDVYDFIFFFARARKTFFSFRGVNGVGSLAAEEISEPFSGGFEGMMGGFCDVFEDEGMMRSSIERW